MKNLDIPFNKISCFASLSPKKMEIKGDAGEKSPAKRASENRCPKIPVLAVCV
jgi:hypothetical protein